MVLAGPDRPPLHLPEAHLSPAQRLHPPLTAATEPHVSNYTTQSGRVGSAPLEDISSMSSPRLFDMLMSGIGGGSKGEGGGGDSGVNRRFDFFQDTHDRD